MNIRPLLCALATAAAAALLPLPVAMAAEQPSLLPLDMGNHWEYQSLGGMHQVETITGTRTILGRTVVVKSYSGGPDAGLENWWITGPAGEVLLAGFDSPSLGRSLAYEPPIIYCGGAPLVGDTWLTHVTAYDLPSNAVYAQFDVIFGALENVSLTVPAGTFPCIGVGQVPPPVAPTAAQAATGGFRLDGRQAMTATASGTPAPSDWFSPGIGIVQYSTGDLFQLSGFGNPTPVRVTSWGALKQSHR